MNKIKDLFKIIIPIVLVSCSDPNFYLCECKYENSETGLIEIKSDTIKGMSKEAAEVECSNYATKDDPNETINCGLK